MKPTFKVLVIANDAPWASWPDKVAYIQNFFAPIATVSVDVVHTSFTVPFSSFNPGVQPYEVLNGLCAEVNTAWYAKYITPLAKGYDISLFVLPNTEWPLFNCVRGVTQFGTPKPIPCEISGDENEATYLNGVKLFDTTVHYGVHELCHALFELSGVSYAQDTTHYWDFNQKNLAGVLADIKFKPMANQPTPQAPGPTAENPDILYPDWSTQKHAYHNVRVLCDLAGLSVDAKNLICACVYQESQFIITAKGKTNPNGTHDWGICQFNDGHNAKGVPLWIGPGAQFPSVDYVLATPEACVKEMIAMYKAGHLNWWASCSTGAYKQWLAPNSPMWLLKS